ncbi:PAS domain S-box protein [Sediminibacterium sp.]|uniref:PAS domain S-box protein n=1 Tax=Sediminibacterium sp. TaxID=1917865 RepID=UPI002733CFE3|nr:PAS domain S-box protein [Sediminibacterium sp.]MDP3392305.1 PAS domain S-box protein [Sediminibacterium sp.]MDP3566893.1 PAS domain S-box protein [Sediminibacterium sp.]
MPSSENFSGDEFKKLSQHLPDLIFQFTRKPDGNYCVPVASKGIENIFGCKPEDVRESFEPIVKVMHPDDQLKILEAIEQSANDMTDFTMEARICIPGRPMQWIFTRSTPEKLSDGTITWYGFSANITKQKLDFDKIAALYKKQDAILKAIPDLIFEIGEDRTIHDYHSPVKDILAAPPALFIGKKYNEIIANEASEALDNAILETNEKGYSTGHQYSLKLSKGLMRFELSVAPIQQEFDNERRYIVLSKDITERKKKEDKLQQLMHAVEQSTSSIVITNLEGNLEYVNQQFLKTTGYSYEEVIGNNPRILNSGYTKKEEYKNLWDTIKSGGTWHGEFLNKKKNGSLFWEEVTISPVRNHVGEIINFLAIKTDITKQKKTSEKLRKIAWDQSHQVRGPLTDILGIINVIKLDISIQEKVELLSHLEKAANQLDLAIHKVIDETKKPL